MFFNGDILRLDNANEALAQSSADSVMLGCGTAGTPWRITGALSVLTAENVKLIFATHASQIARDHYRDILKFYGDIHGTRGAKICLAGYVDSAPVMFSADRRALLCRQAFWKYNPEAAIILLVQIYGVLSSTVGVVA